MGEVTVKFNSSMVTEKVNLTEINSTVFDMYLQPSNNRHLDEDDFNMSKINFTWKTKSFEKD